MEIRAAARGEKPAGASERKLDTARGKKKARSIRRSNAAAGAFHSDVDGRDGERVDGAYAGERDGGREQQRRRVIFGGAHARAREIAARADFSNDFCALVVFGLVRVFRFYGLVLVSDGYVRKRSGKFGENSREFRRVAVNEIRLIWYRASAIRFKEGGLVGIFFKINLFFIF